MTQDNNNEVTFEYDSAGSTVDHSHLGVAGDDHPLGDDPIDWSIENMRAFIEGIADDLYSSWEATIREYIANGETACLKVERALDPDADSIYSAEELDVIGDYQPKIEITWNRAENTLTIKDNGIGMPSAVVKKVYARISNTTSLREGDLSGAFGWGVLSFVKIEGNDDYILMKTNPRQTSENFVAKVSMAGLESLPGELPSEEFGTTFEMTPQNTDWDIRQAVETYSRHIRVPVIYNEYDEQGEHCFDEEWGGESLTDTYSADQPYLSFEKPGFFKAYATSAASNKTLLLSMPIDRNAPDLDISNLSFDVRLEDESGTVVESSNGHVGKIPTARSDYQRMLLEAREDSIPKGMLARDDTVARDVESQGITYTVFPDDTFEELFPNGAPKDNYISESEEDSLDTDTFGEEYVFSGEHEGRIVVSQDEWEKLPEGKASQFVPVDVLEPYDVESGEGDLTLPEPKSDRDSLQDNDVFWRYVETEFANQFKEYAEKMMEQVESADDPDEAIDNIDRSYVKELVNGPQ